MRAARDRGSATIWVAMAATVLCVVFAAVLAMGQAVVARHRAGSAADLAALAAADHALQGAGHACEKAATVARAQGAAVVRCAVQGEIADVTAQVRFGPYGPTVRSRAGPPEAAAPGQAPQPPQEAHPVRAPQLPDAGQRRPSEALGAGSPGPAPPRAVGPSPGQTLHPPTPPPSPPHPPAPP